MKKLVLVVDDEKNMRKSLRRILEFEGYEVVEASDGDIAVEQLYLHPVDLVITDIYMPEQDGLWTINIIRTDFPKVKIIAISGVVQPVPFHPLEVADGLGADRVFYKPFDNDEILCAVRELVGG